MVYVTHNAFWKAKWWPIDPDLLLIRALSTAVVAHAVAPKENKDVPVIDQMVAFAAVQPPPFSVAQLLAARAQWAKHVAARDAAARGRSCGATLGGMILMMVKMPKGESLMRYSELLEDINRVRRIEI